MAAIPGRLVRQLPVQSAGVNGEQVGRKKREGELARTEDSVEGAPFLQNGAPCLPSLIAVVAPADHGGFPRILQAPQTPAPTRVNAGFSCLGRIVSASLFAHQNHPKGLTHAPKGPFFFFLVLAPPVQGDSRNTSSCRPVAPLPINLDRSGGLSPGIPPGDVFPFVSFFFMPCVYNYGIMGCRVWRLVGQSPRGSHGPQQCGHQASNANRR